MENCKDSADSLFTTCSSDGQREHQQARKSPASTLQPARPSKISPIGSFHITQSLKSGPSRFPVEDLCLNCYSVHHPARFQSYTHYVAETEPICVCFKWRWSALIRQQSNLLHYGHREDSQRERLPGQTSKIKPLRREMPCFLVRARKVIEVANTRLLGYVSL